MQSSRLKIGKIKEFNGYSGEIVSLEGVYYFTRRDIVDGMTLQNNDVVIFNGKTEIANKRFISGSWWGKVKTA